MSPERKIDHVKGRTYRMERIREDFDNPRSGFRKLLEDTGKALADIRRSSFGLSQKELSKAGRFNINSISRAEQGKGEAVTVHTLWRLARAQGYDMQITFVKNRKDTYGQLRSDDVRRAVSAGDKGRADVEPEPEREDGDGSVGPGSQD